MFLQLLLLCLSVDTEKLQTFFTLRTHERGRKVSGEESSGRFK